DPSGRLSCGDAGRYALVVAAGGERDEPKGGPVSVPSHEGAAGKATGIRAAILEQIRPQRRQLARRLRPYLSPVVSTDDPAALLEIVTRERLPLVIIELALPGIDTLEVLRDLRQRFESLNLAAVVTFASDEITD